MSRYVRRKSIPHSNVHVENTFFVKHITTLNIRAIHYHNIMGIWILNDNPYLLNTSQISSCNPHEGYENLFNCVQRHTKCNVDSCLHKEAQLLLHITTMLHERFMMNKYYSYIINSKGILAWMYWWYAKCLQC